jgi:antitoxin component of MazEF toxin-antitoxin module
VISALRIEWCKVYARIHRWREETRLLEEEVRRLPIALEHVSKEWDARAQALALDTMSVEEGEGGICYVMKQAAIYRGIAVRVAVTMTELKFGRGKRRKQAEVDKLMGGMGARADRNEEEIEAEEDEEELLDLCGDAADDEHMLGGGEDD